MGSSIDIRNSIGTINNSIDAFKELFEPVLDTSLLSRLFKNKPPVYFITKEFISTVKEVKEELGEEKNLTLLSKLLFINSLIENTDIVYGEYLKLKGIALSLLNNLYTSSTDDFKRVNDLVKPDDNYLNIVEYFLPIIVTLTLSRF